MAHRKFARSTTSGSRAAFSSTVSPSANVAAIMRFSVPVTVTVSSTRSRALEAARARLDVAVFDVNVRAHRLQARDVNIDRPRSDRAAAGQRDVRRTEAREQGPEHQNRCAHGLHELIGGEIFLDRRGIDLDAHFLVDGHRDAHAPEQLDHGGDVLQMRHVRYGHRPVRQQATRQNGQGRILRAGDANLALERDAAVNLQFIHWLPALRIFFRREDLQRERVDLVAHGAAERRVHQLVPLHGDAYRRKPRRSPPPRNARCPRS